jgi:adenylosuccinate synthase
MTSLALTKLDVVAGLGQLQVCEAYRLGDRVLEEMPAEADELAAVHPVLRTVPGFDGELGGARTFEELPTGARDYVELIERELQLPVSLISVGPQRRQTLRRGELAEESPAGGRAAR